MPIAPRTSTSCWCQAPIRFLMRCNGVIGVGLFQENGAGFAALAFAAQPALQCHQKRYIDGHQIRPANDGLGHVFGQGDSARSYQSYLVAGAVFYQCPMNFPQHVAGMPGLGVARASCPV